MVIENFPQGGFLRIFDMFYKYIGRINCAKFQIYKNLFRVTLVIDQSIKGSGTCDIWLKSIVHSLCSARNRVSSFRTVQKLRRFTVTPP